MRVCEFGEERVLRPIFEGLKIKSGVFLDIGAGGPYSNTDWLKAEGWSGLQIDAANGPSQHVTIGNLEALALHDGVVDFLSVDVDGMDYWLVKAILDRGHRPRVVCVEFNQSKREADDIQPYDPSFVWPGGTTFGCSWQALDALCESHGYILAFKNLVNCVFVINDARTLGAMFPRSQG